MANNEGNETATGADSRRLRELWASPARRRPRRLKLRAPRVTGLRLAVLGVVALAIVAWCAVAVSSTSIYPAQVVIVDGSAYGVPPLESLDFGEIPRGSRGERMMTFENNGRIPTAAVILELGSVGGLLKMSDAFFTLDPGDKKQIIFTAEAPASGEATKYSGKVIVLRVPWWQPW